MLRQQRSSVDSRFAWISLGGAHSRNVRTDQIGSINIQKVHRDIGGSTATIEYVKVGRVIATIVIQVRGCTDPNERRPA